MPSGTIIGEVLGPAQRIDQPHLLDCRARCLQKPRRGDNDRKAPGMMAQTTALSLISSGFFPGQHIVTGVAVELALGVEFVCTLWIKLYNKTSPTSGSSRIIGGAHADMAALVYLARYGARTQAPFH
jgi:hypothetical protein